MTNERKNELPDPVEYTGSANSLRNSRFLSAADLSEAGLQVGGFVTVTIQRVLRRDNVVSQFSGRAETMTTLEFVGRKKEFRVGSVIQKTLVKLFGDDTRDWKGKQVQLVLAQRVDNQTGEVNDTIILRGVPAQRTAQQAPKAQPTEDPYEGMRPENETAPKDEIPF